MAAQLPDPNFGDALNNYTGEAGAVLDYNQYAVRMDHTLTGKDRLYGRVAIQDNIRTNQPLIPYLSKHLQGKGRVFSSTWARVLGSSAVNEFRVGYVRGIYGDSIDEIDPAQFGIQNTTLETLPRLFLSTGNLNYGGFSASIITETQDTFQLADNFSLIRGRHGLKAGFILELQQVRQHGIHQHQWHRDLQRSLYDREQQCHDDARRTRSPISSWAPPRPRLSTACRRRRFRTRHGRFTFRTTGRSAIASPSALDFATRSHQFWKSSELGGAAMDLDGEGRLFVVDPEIAALSNSPLVVCCTSSRAVDPDWNDLAPRLSAVFKPFAGNHSTVVRAGYGLYYSDTTQFFNWSSFVPLKGAVFQGVTGDFSNPAARLPDLFPSTNFTQGGGVIPFFQAGVPPAIHGDKVINVAGTVAKDNRTPYSHQWSLSVQRELMPSLLLDVTYQGALGRNLPTQWIFNQAPASPNTANFASPDPTVNPFLRRPYRLLCERPT